MEFRLLEQLIGIADAGTLARAGEALHISQPALTRSMQKLERELGVHLFQRTGNRMILTETGTQAVEKAHRLLAEKERMIQELQDFERRHTLLHIASVAPSPLWELERELESEKQPFFELEADREEILAALRSKKLEAGVFLEPVHTAGLISRPLFEEKLYLMVDETDELAKQESIRFDQLNGRSLLCLESIGIWKDLCERKLPDSHILYQQDAQSIQLLSELSRLPTFKTDLTLCLNPAAENRRAIPFTDEDARVSFWLVFPEEQREQLEPLARAVNRRLGALLADFEKKRRAGHAV